MRVYPQRHNVEFGETVRWVTPPGTAAFYAWQKTAAHTSGEVGVSELAYGGHSPVWMQAAGFDVSGDAVIDVEGRDATEYTPAAAGLVIEWQKLLAIFDGHDPEVLMVTAQGSDGRVFSIDRYALPAPNSTDAATIAAQERRLLQTLLNAREKVASRGGMISVDEHSDGNEAIAMSVATLDRRVVEVRARIAWFDQAAAGNNVPRMEVW